MAYPRYNNDIDFEGIMWHLTDEIYEANEDFLLGDKGTDLMLQVWESLEYPTVEKAGKELIKCLELLND